MSLKKVCIVLLSALFATAPLWLPSFVFAAGDDTCGWSPGNWANCGLVLIAQLLNVIVAVVAYLLYLAGIILEYTLQFTIYTPYNNIEAIKAGWGLLRDLINLIFIFLLLYVAIATILNADNTTWRKQVVQIIVAAILINFSLFITRVVVDAGNILAIQFYEQVTTCAEAAEVESCEDGEQDIVDSFMAGMGLQKSFGAGAFNEDLSGGDAAGNSIKNSLLRLVLIIVAAFAFFTAAILFLARTVAIVFLLVLSPIGIAGANIPMLSKHAQTWRQTLFAQTFVPAVFLFFIFLILALIGEGGFFQRDEVGIGGGESDTGGELDAEYFFNFIIIVAFIIAAVRITKSLSGQVGQFMDGVTKTVVGAGIAVATGGTAAAARATVGAAASRATSSGELKERAAQGGLKGGVAKMQLGAADRLSKSSFDARNSGAMKFASKQSGMKFGKAGGKGGYQKTVENREKAAVEQSKLYGTSTEEAAELEAEKDKKMKQVETLERQAAAMDEGQAKRRALGLAKQRKAEAENLDPKAVTRRRQEAFAQSLENDAWWKKVRRNTYGSNEDDRVNQRQAAAVRKNMSKSKPEQLLEELSGHLKDSGEPKDEDSESKA